MNLQVAKKTCMAVKRWARETGTLFVETIKVEEVAHELMPLRLRLDQVWMWRLLPRRHFGL
jgi:hypothetical protein